MSEYSKWLSKWRAKYWDERKLEILKVLDRGKGLSAYDISDRMMPRGLPIIEELAELRADGLIVHKGTDNNLTEKGKEYINEPHV